MTDKSIKMLKINNLFVSVEGKQILNGVSFEVKPKEIHVLMGPNGAGKSSLAMALAGHPLYKFEIRFSARNLLKASNSKFEIDGKDMKNLTPDQRAKAGLFVSFQVPPAIPGVKLTNMLHLAKGGDFSVFYQNLKEKLSELKLDTEFLSRSLNEDFSGGEKKKMEILQALILQPKYIIFDEIDTGLDVDSLQLVAQKIKELSKKSGVLIITHYQRLLQYLTPDKVWIMKAGKIVLSGGAELARQIEKKGYENISVGMTP